jgi:hypothetical protein
MLSRDIHYGKPTVYNAIQHLDVFLKSVKRSESIVEVITGYGSSGGSSKIKNAVINKLEEYKENKYIKDYICGNELDIFNSKYQTFQYKSLISEDIKKRRNPGAIYVIL